MRSRHLFTSTSLENSSRRFASDEPKPFLRVSGGCVFRYIVRSTYFSPMKSDGNWRSK